MLPKRFVYPSPGFSRYWNEGSGKKMLEKLDIVPAKEEIEANGKLLLQYDLIGDRVINEVFEKLGFKQATGLIDQALNNGIDSVKDAPESLVQLFAEADKIPDWLNQDLLKTGSEYCRRAGSFALVVLRNYCLMGGYESSAINKPLIYTQALKKGAAKRMAETVEFWVHVTGEDAMQRDGIGFKSAIKVRLMHAYSRVAIQKTPGWDNDLWGQPINLGDMVATNLGFSLAFMDGLKKVGIRPTEKEIRGVLHLWKYIGYLLGIPPAWLPDTETEAIAALYKWTITQSAADEDTRALAHALMLEPLIRALPFWNMTVTYRIPLKSIALDETSSIGLHIKKKRLELKLRQKDVALLVGVTEECIMYWETDFAKPQIQYAPKIIKFLGYNPYVMETETLGGKVKNYRLLHGLSHKKMGGIVGVDGATISTWETGKFKPEGANLNRLNAILSE